MTWSITKIIAAAALLVLVGSILRPGAIEVAIVALFVLGVIAIARGRRALPIESIRRS
ncbi:MAG: hypothetical protein ACK5YR_15845 [Pirellula sp.]